MTTVFETAVTCAVCGREQSVQEMGSTSSFGPMDLDTRPPPVRRHSLWLWVHECEECGFVCRSLLDEAAGDLVAAGWRRVHAAWASDDAGHDTEARVQRFEAIGLFEQRLAVACDPDCHTVAEVEAPAESVGNRGGDDPQHETLH
jgi:hypothetical protein